MVATISAGVASGGASAMASRAVRAHSATRAPRVLITSPVRSTGTLNKNDPTTAAATAARSAARAAVWPGAWPAPPVRTARPAAGAARNRERTDPLPDDVVVLGLPDAGVAAAAVPSAAA